MERKYQKMKLMHARKMQEAQSSIQKLQGRITELEGRPIDDLISNDTEKLAFEDLSRDY